MATLTQTIKQLTNSIEDAGYPVRGFVPEKINPPMIVVEKDEPYLTEADTFGSPWTIHLLLALVTGGGSNQQITASLDSMIERVLPHIPDDWTAQVELFGQRDVNATRQGVAFIAVSTTFDLG